MKLAIGLPLSHGFPAPSEFWDSYETLMQHIASGQTNHGLTEALQITAVNRIKSTSFPVDVNRNDIVRQMLKSDAQYLLFLDADMRHPADLVARLLGADKPVITARYHMRKPPYHAVAYVKHRAHEGAHAYQPVHFGQGVFEIERGGGGALLIRRDVLEAIQFRIGENWFRYQRGPEAPHDFTVSEDFWFYQQAREAGFPCWIDWDCECGHLQTFEITGEYNRTFLDKQVEELPTLSPERRQTVVENFVVCGFPEGMTLPTGDHIRPYAYMPGER